MYTGFSVYTIYNGKCIQGVQYIPNSMVNVNRGLLSSIYNDNCPNTTVLLPNVVASIFELIANPKIYCS